MCTNCDDSSVIVPIGLPGDNGADGVAYNGVDGVEDKIIFDTSLNITYTTEEFTNNMPLLSDGITYDQNAYQEVGVFIFPGSSILNGNTPNLALFSMRNTDATKWQVRLRAESLVIAETAAYTLPVATPVLIASAPITNFPEDTSICYIEVRPLTNNTEDTLYINSLMILKY